MIKTFSGYILANPIQWIPTMRLADSYPLAEWKLLYRVLHSQLRKTAQNEGVDVGDHGAWDAWLGNTDAPSCSIRNTQRETWN